MWKYNVEAKCKSKHAMGYSHSFANFHNSTEANDYIARLIEKYAECKITRKQDCKIVKEFT